MILRLIGFLVVILLAIVIPGSGFLILGYLAIRSRLQAWRRRKLAKGE